MTIRRGGFTLLELTCALVVIAVTTSLAFAIVRSSARARVAVRQMALASSIAQGALERLRAVPYSVLRTEAAWPLELPPESAHLPDARMRAELSGWNGHEGLTHVKVVLQWTSPQGHTRSIVREGLVGDDRTR